jgi:aminodeoxyfutalosine deaminase
LPSNTVVRADWILPVSGPPVRDGFVAVADGRITAVGSSPPADAVPLGRVAVLPALVNAHTHLELSYLHRRVPVSTNFNEWVSTLMTVRSETAGAASEIAGAAQAAIAQARATGTGLIGDVCNTLVTVPLLRDAGMPAQVFHELIGFNHPDPSGKVRAARASLDAIANADEQLRISLAPHAPYSVSPALFTAIRDDLASHANDVSTVHLGESSGEVEFLRYGTGVVQAMLQRLGVWVDDWQVPGVSPTDYVTRLGFLSPRVLVVHGVQFTREDLGRLRALGAPLVSCPRSNHHVGVGSPPLESFYAAGVTVAFGTDSLASVEDLSMFAELAEARRVAPGVPARVLIHSATLAGARALRFDADYGSIAPGKRASLITVRVPPHVDDVEEYLVGGIEPDAIGWL